MSLLPPLKLIYINAVNNLEGLLVVDQNCSLFHIEYFEPVWYMEKTTKLAGSYKT